MKRIAAVILIISIGILNGIIIDRFLLFKVMKEKELEIKKYKDYFRMMSRWFFLKSEGKRIEDFFLKYGYKRIAIYGMGILGKHLFDETKDSQVMVEYAIDRSNRIIHEEIEVLSLDEKIRNVDVIVITVISEFEELQDKLRKRNAGAVISLEKVLFDDMWNKKI